MKVTEGKYNVILDTMPATETRKEVLFRCTGDGFLQVEYGQGQVLDIFDSFRVQAVNDKINSVHIKGLLETVPALRTNLYHFDPAIISINKLIGAIKECEEDVKSVEDIVIYDLRIFELPMVFEDSETKKAVEKYAQEIRPDAPYIIDGYNLKWLALYNGLTVPEVKEKLVTTQYWCSAVGFWPGTPFLWPLDPRCALSTPKYNPPRTWTPEAAVGYGGMCYAIYSTPSGGGYQLFGRTIPIFQFSQKHKMFKESPVLLRAKDIVQFVPIDSEEALSEIHRLVHEEGKYDYKVITYEMFSARKYLDFLAAVNEEADEFKKKKAKAMAAAPRV
jgi:allophanate hydrolase subunit 1